MQKKKDYIQPTVKLYTAELSSTILGYSEPTRSGYAIDNYEADDSQIIPITEQGKSPWDDDFVDID